MASGKKTNNAPTEEFILEAPAPVDVAAKVSAIYRALSVEVNASNFIYRKTYSFSLTINSYIITITFNNF